MLLDGEDAKNEEDDGQNDQKNAEYPQKACSALDTFHAFLHHFFSDLAELLIESGQGGIGAQIVGKDGIRPARRRGAESVAERQSLHGESVDRTQAAAQVWAGIGAFNGALQDDDELDAGLEQNRRGIEPGHPGENPVDGPWVFCPRTSVPCLSSV